MAIKHCKYCGNYKSPDKFKSLDAEYCIKCETGRYTKSINTAPLQKGFVYFCYSDAQKLVKIGFTRSDVNKRINNIRTMSPSPIRLLAYVHTIADHESQLHSQFALYRHHGEWFRFEGKLREYVIRLLS